MTLAQTLDRIDLEYGAPMSVFSDMLRAMICAAPGHDLIAADYSNIEGRVLAWLAGEHWKVEAFRAYDEGRGDDIYKITAGEILGKPAKAIDKNERQSHGKIPELALGFGGGVQAFHAMARIYNASFTDEEAEAIKVRWREKHPKVKAFWYNLEEAAIDAVRNPGTVFKASKILFRMAGSFLWCRLPSGRSLCYPYPAIKEREAPWFNREPSWVPCPDIDEAHFLYGLDVRFDPERRAALVLAKAKKAALHFMGVDPLTKQWCEQNTYGGSLAENVTQAVARDILADGMLRLTQIGYNICMHCHDEVVIELPEAEEGLEDVCNIMRQAPKWATGLPLSVEGFRRKRYGK
jgi:DNA polymerase